MTRSFLVAEHLFKVNIPDSLKAEFRMENYAPFAVEAGEELFSLEVAAGAAPEFTDCELVIDQGAEPGETVISLWRLAGGWLVKMAPSPGRPISGLLTLDKDFKHGTLYVLRPAEADFALNNSLMLQYAFATATLGTLEMHASTVVNGGKAYLFLAKSGTGKSTHSKMWLKAIPGTHLMNDDNPVVRLFADGRVIAYGSPWSGKTPCYRNESFPVGGFVRIERAPFNRLDKLSIVEAYASVYSSCSGFKADRAMGDGLHSAISAAIQGAPCFVMHCLPDEDAARVCFNGVTAL
ncbi:MAG: hypothetical protein J5667_03300 [Bacteroidales bacterium]|nr:hypothetical protein [Bacteroidales bacterium]